MNAANPAVDVAYVPLAFGLAIGAAVALVVFLAVRALALVPSEDRTFRDRPPRGFRLVWWPIQWLSHYAGPLFPNDYRQRSLDQLRRAGLDYTLSPAQFFAAQFIAGLLAAVATVLMGALLTHDGASYARSAAAALAGFFYPVLWRRERIERRRRILLKQLPFYLDIITLCVEAGLNLTGAFEQAMSKGPPGALRDEIARILRDVRAGKPRLEALRDWAQRMKEAAITNLVAALIQAETMGVSLGPILRAQAEQRRSERFARAEKLALEAPVKMLFPLIAFIFPCTFVVIAFPIVMKFLMLGL